MLNLDGFGKYEGLKNTDKGDKEKPCPSPGEKKRKGKTERQEKSLEMRVKGRDWRKEIKNQDWHIGDENLSKQKQG